MTPDLWNKRYEELPFAYGEAPCAFMAACRGLLPATGRALLPGDGQGRNGVWLAKQGLNPLCIDLSDVALEQARAFAKREGVTIDTWAGDFLEADFGAPDFALAVACYIHVPSAIRIQIHRKMAGALAKGGLIVLEAFAVGQQAYKEKYDSGGPRDDDKLVSAAGLKSDFSDLEPLYVEELEIVLHDGPLHDGLAKVVRALFRKA